MSEGNACPRWNVGMHADHYRIAAFEGEVPPAGEGVPVADLRAFVEGISEPEEAWAEAYTTSKEHPTATVQVSRSRQTFVARVHADGRVEQAWGASSISADSAVTFVVLHEQGPARASFHSFAEAAAWARTSLGDYQAESAQLRCHQWTEIGRLHNGREEWRVNRLTPAEHRVFAAGRGLGA